MTATVTPDSTLVHRANLNIAAAVMAKSGPRMPDSLIGRAIDEIRASHPVAELAESGNMPMVVSAVETFLARHHEADRPRNLYGAEAARAAQAAGDADHSRGGAGFGTIDAIRAGSSARYRDLPTSDSNRRSGSAEAAAASGYATAESLNYVGATNFGRTPFAAAGMNYGVVGIGEQLAGLVLPAARIEHRRGGLVGEQPVRRLQPLEQPRVYRPRAEKAAFPSVTAGQQNFPSFSRFTAAI